MNSNKLNGKKSFLVYLPFIIFFIIIFLWHFMIPSVNDDVSFGRMFYEQNLFSSLSFHYETWTSRLLIEFFLIPLAGLPRIIWNFFDSIVFVLIAVLIPKIMWYNEKNDKSLVYYSISCILVSIYIYTISPALHSAGYIATTLNYTWPLFFGLLHFYLVKEYIFTKKNLGPLKKIVIYVLMLFALLFAINQELLMFVVSGVYFIIILYCLHNKIKIPKSILLIFFMISLGFLNFLLCPGNHLRYPLEILNRFPDYHTLTLVNKIDLGITVLLNRIMLAYGLINLFFFAILGLYIYSITKKKISLLISLIPILIIITLGLVILMGYLPIVSFLGEGNMKYGLLNCNLNYIIIKLIIYGIIIFPVIYGIAYIYKTGRKKLSFLIFCLLILGFASQMMRGFSPTCWATAERWEIYYYFFITYATYILSVKLLEKYTIVK